MCKLLLSLMMVMGALPGPGQFAGLDVQEVKTSRKRAKKAWWVEVTVPTAQVVIRDADVTVISTMSALDNSRLVRVVGKLTFDRPIGPLVVDSATRKEVVILGSGVRLRVTGDALCHIEPLVEDINVTYQSMINAEWDKGTGDHMFADRIGGSLLLVSGGGSYDQASRIVTTTLKMGRKMGVAALPSAPWDPARLYAKGARPHVTFVYSLQNVNLYLGDPDQWFGNLAERDFGSVVLFGELYKSGVRPEVVDGDTVYRWKDEDAMRRFISEAHRRGLKVLSYMQAGVFQPQFFGPSSALAFLKSFTSEWNLDGWYFDNAKVSTTWWENYKFIRDVRDLVGDSGVIYHHSSVDVWGGWSGLVFAPSNAWSNYTLLGETGTLAKIDSVGNPYLFFVTRGFSGVPIVCHKLSKESTLSRNVMHMLLSYPEMRGALRIGFPSGLTLSEFDDHYWSGYVKARDVWRRAKELGWLCDNDSTRD